MIKMNSLPILLFLSTFFAIQVHGAPAKEARIVGGSDATSGQFPWLAAIYLDNLSGKYFCGGALISDQYIVTGAQCVYGARTFTILLGSNTLLSKDDNRKILYSSTYVVHPDYNQNTLENDIGLIKLDAPVAFSNYVQTITVASANLAENVSVVAAGWGQTRDNAAGISNVLSYVDLSVITNTECQATYGSQIKDGMACAVGIDNEGICTGDTGGPLVVTDSDGKMVHVAVASFTSQNGCQSNDPSGYTRTDVYSSWIADTIK